MHHNVLTTMCLENIGVKMISQFPLDLMHLVDLGVTKKIMNFFITENRKYLDHISEQYCQFSEFIPDEFNRKTR